MKGRRAEVLVVGAGAAGAVIAARASAAGKDVLLIEAGPDYASGELPEDLRDGTRNSMVDHDWGYRHFPVGRRVPFDFPRGRVVGGSTAVNTCIALRGHPYDHDEWGLEPWRWEHCLPAYKRLERDLDRRDEWHGQRGPIPLRRHRPEEFEPWQEAFVSAARGLGFGDCEDFNAPDGTGVGPHAMNKIDGERMSAARCYLTPAVRQRENLNIIADALVRRVLFEGRRAVGVEVERQGQIERYDAALVVLCAGAINTPGVLLRSGVGPQEQVARLGVDVVSDVPAVGAKLLDHPGAAMILLPKEGLSRPDGPIIQTALRFTSQTEGRFNDLQIQAGSFVPFPFADIPMVSLMIQINKPHGHGLLRYRSADPREKPEIESRFLEDPDDMALAIEAMEMCWLLATSDAMRPLARFFLPGERALSSRKALRRFLPSQTGSGYHPCGTVPMGTSLAQGAATDAWGRVFGTENLVVADASLFPTVPSSNTNLPTLMLGERFGEWIASGELSP